MGSPGTLTLMGGQPKFGNDPQYRAKAGRDKFHPTAPDPKTKENYRTGPPKNWRRGLPSPVRLWAA